MSELGSNQGQDENKNTTVFDSANLAEKQKAEHFANVEGSEARAKAAEREVEAAKKKAEAAHVNEIKKAAKKEAGGSKGGILNFLFGGWHKWVFIALTLVICAVVVLLYVVSNTSVVDEHNAEEKIENFKNECDNISLEGDYCFEALEDIEGYIENEKNFDIKIKLLKEYEEYVMLEYGDYSRVKNVLDKNTSDGLSEDNKHALCDIYKDLYYKSDNWEEYVKECEL